MNIPISREEATKIRSLYPNAKPVASFTDMDGTCPDGYHGIGRRSTAYELTPSVWLWYREQWDVDTCGHATSDPRCIFTLEMKGDAE